MAYLDFSGFNGQPLAASGMVETAATLTALEWQVVAIAQRDRLSSLEAPGRWSRLFALFFGGDRASPRLADSKLEALRRVAVLAWHKGYALPKQEIAAFHASGYSLDQLEVLLARVSQGRAALNEGRGR
ncbi:hypothetical protein S2M10_21670 [Sphingomonas sp. S2M10]|jgi:hypothetical protein|uniref:hypothetical protein n=1 Tax=Sphingomonas sp. S2M10 TaxID=2705010 RepID=UPI001456959D|nr:hypothetical protein [Sphingomonas sp. S2M10]NLS27174.1 hypothetical protein [Sphingomonas sp. S2M10]